MRLVSVSIAMAAAFLTACAKPAAAGSLGVDLQEELASATVITRARILAYDPEGLRFQPLPEPLQPIVARYSDDPTWKPRELGKGDFPIYAFTGAWPPVGAEVLVVVDAHNVISLFAWPIGDTYRFWSPEFTGSAAFFVCWPPAKVLHPMPYEPSKDALTERGERARYETFDGCFMPVSSVTTRGVKR